MFWLRQIPQWLLPYLLIAMGVFLILCGTVLYWPAERLGERMDQNEKNQRDWTYRNTRRVSIWIKNDPTRRLIVRGFSVAMGIFGVAWGIWVLVR
jgi:hypothetical protein